MNDDDNDDYDSEANNQWRAERRHEVAVYLQGEGISHGSIGDEPAWQVPPYVSVWAIESLGVPGNVGWWVISGDLPHDYVSGDDAKNPREAVQAIASLWAEAAQYMAGGEKHPTFRIGTGDRDDELAPLLRSRAELLLEFVEDAEAWDDGDA